MKGARKLEIWINRWLLESLFFLIVFKIDLKWLGNTIFLKMVNVVYMVIKHIFFVSFPSQECSHDILNWEVSSSRELPSFFVCGFRKSFLNCTSLLSFLLSPFLPSFLPLFWRASHATSGHVLFWIFRSEFCWTRSSY